MAHEVLTKTFERLGSSKPHIKKETEVKNEKEEEEAKRPLSPVEPTSGAISAELPIQVKTDGEGEEVKLNDNVDVKRIEEDEDADADAAPAPKDESVPPPTNGTSTTDTTNKGSSARKPGRPKKHRADNADPIDLKSKPYEGLFEANIRMDLSPPVVEIKDLRTDVEGGEKTWTEDINCLVCGSRIN